MRVLVTGAGGMLADAVGATFAQADHRALGTFLNTRERDQFIDRFRDSEIVELGRSRPDRIAVEKLRDDVRKFEPEWILHLAAWTDVDGCESDWERAMRSNALACFEAALVARETNTRLLTISTDYIFDGNSERPYAEDDAAAPLSVYGKSKWLGEQLVRETWSRHVVLRTSWLFGPWGRNFVDTIARKLWSGERVAVVNDQFGCPTYTYDLAEAIVQLVERGAEGTYHVSNSGSTSWFEFALEIGNALGKRGLVSPATTAELGRPAPRPRYSVLDNGKFEATTGAALRPWQSALHDYLPVWRKHIHQEAR